MLLSNAGSYGIQIVDDQLFNPGNDIETQLMNTNDTDAQAVVCWGFENVPRVAREMQRLDLGIPMLSPLGNWFTDGANYGSQRVLFPAMKLLMLEMLPEVDPQKDVLNQYKIDYEQQFYGDVDTFGGHLYDALSMVVLALEAMPEELSTADARSFIRDEIEGIDNYVGIGGVFNMSSQDHLGLLPGSLAIVEIVDGEWTLAE